METGLVAVVASREGSPMKDTGLPDWASIEVRERPRIEGEDGTLHFELSTLEFGKAGSDKED
jgi:hypothetical protein